MKLLPLQDVTAADLPFVFDPFYAWCMVHTAHGGFLRIEGYDEHFENCTRKACQLAGDSDHWNARMLGRERMDAYVKRGSLALVMDKDRPLSPTERAFIQKTDGRCEPSERIWQPEIRARFTCHVDRVYRERQEREGYAANHSPIREPEYLPAGGPGTRQGTLGPHAGDSIQATNTNDSPTPEVISARKESARQFYQEQGMPEHRIEAHMEGIDFSKPVERVKLGKGTIVEQHQIPNAAQGNYYSQTGTNPHQLGVSNNVLDRKTGELVSRQPRQYLVNQETEVLRSSARAVEDTWSVAGKSIKTEGGGIQYFTMQRGNFTAT